MFYQQKRKFRLIFLPAAMALSVLLVACIEVRFDGLALGTQYPVGTSFTADGVTIDVTAFPTGSSDYAEVQDGHGITGVSRDIWTRRAGLAPQFPYPLQKVEVFCLAYGVTHYFEVNGQRVNFRKTEALAAQTVAGVAVTDDTQSQNVSRRVTRITLTGPIDSFTIGGDELAVAWIKAKE